MPRAASSRLLRIHRRALLAALEGAGGDVQRAARALGILPQHIRALLVQGEAAGDPHTSGTRRRISSPLALGMTLGDGTGDLGGGFEDDLDHDLDDDFDDDLDDDGGAASD